jgi:hypothetical protein
MRICYCEYNTLVKSNSLAKTQGEVHEKAHG